MVSENDLKEFAHHIGHLSNLNISHLENQSYPLKHWHSQGKSKILRNLSNGLLKQTQTDSNQKYFQDAHDHNKSISMKTDVNSGEGWVGSNCEVDVTPQLDRLLYNLLPQPPLQPPLPRPPPQHAPNPSIPRCPPSTPTIPNLTTISIPRSQTMSRLCIIWLLRLWKAIKSLDK